MTGGPGFLQTPPRESKPRQRGLTHVLDKAVPIEFLEAHLEQSGELIDIVKIGWGLGYLDGHITQRAEACRRHDALLVTGGTFLEIAAQQDRVEDFREWALSQGIGAVEVSNGLGLLSREEKQKLIARLCADFVVLSETGSKDPDSPVDPAEWAREMADDLAAGAALVVAEGRESGNVGIYHDDGTVRVDLIDAVVSQVEPASIIFEAPQKSQQLWLIQHLGSDVGLGNVEFSEVPSVESLRLGLRADTAGTFPGTRTA